MSDSEKRRQDVAEFIKTPDGQETYRELTELLLRLFDPPREDKNKTTKPQDRCPGSE
jgi:hypothetical protein